ncbi:MAG: amidohydrolase family protein [Vicinamibacterales bacterium]|nr:hypothetical protein [Acidobacteriota bacterium]MDP6370909.1 amidohydrolase family protein [Vicinamibacterales bacterium]MDP6608375.1 amidohydrolase family protein [Vicinamibacterales bacterium]HAK53994.1 hypothetical protein [Acidobacteriota bacterium]
MDLTRIRGLAFLALVLALCAGPLEQEVAGQSAYLVVRHATLLPEISEAPGADRAIIIHGGVITWIGADPDVEAPPTAVELDAGGRVVIPGLIDLHQHAASVSPSPAAWLAHGVTSIRDPGAALDVARQTQRSIDGGLLEGPRVFIGLELALAAGQTRGAVRRLIADAAIDVDLLQLDRATPPAQAQVAILEAHARGLPVTWHLGLPLARALDLEVDGVEHLDIFRGLAPPLEPASAESLLRGFRRWAELDPSSDGIQDLFRRLAASRTVWTPTLVQAHRIAGDELARSRSLGDRAAAMRGLDAACRTIALAAGLGVLIGAGTSTDRPADLHEELALLVRCGLTATEALRSATTTAAAALGRQSMLGAIVPGHLADLVLLDADPSDDIRATARVWRVVKDGRVHDPTRLAPAEPGTIR